MTSIYIFSMVLLFQDGLENVTNLHILEDVQQLGGLINNA